MAHPTKQERKKDGTFPKTTLNDISGGAHFRNRADFGFVIIRHKHDDPDNATGMDYTEFVMEKSRFGNIASLGTAYLRYQAGSGRFHPFDPVTQETQWDERNYLEEKIIQSTLTMPSQSNVSEGTVAQSESRGSSLTMPSQSNVSEGNVQGFLQQAERADRESKPRMEQDDDLPFDNNNETPF